ncbi:unnamed protein product [Brassica oleracea var. botrytis]
MIDQHSNQNIMTVSGCDDCDSYSKKQYYNLYLLLKQKNTRSMRKAILLSKRTLAHKGSTSQTEENPILACSKCGTLMWASESTVRTAKQVNQRSQFAVTMVKSGFRRSINPQPY